MVGICRRYGERQGIGGSDIDACDVAIAVIFVVGINGI